MLPEFQSLTDNLLKLDARAGNTEPIKYEGKRLVTPHLGLVIPAYGEPNWGLVMANNFILIDKILAGGIPSHL